MSCKKKDDTMKKTIIRMPIGDWSGDGHGKCDYFRVEINGTVEKMREAHFASKVIFDIEENLCSNYEESTVGADLWPDWASFEPAEGEPWDAPVEDRTGHQPDPEEVARLWVELLNKADPSLQAVLPLFPSYRVRSHTPHIDRLLKDGNADVLPFYGFDEKGRHIGFVGYGVFGS